MPAHASAVGTALDVNRVDMTVRKALAYAAGIADTATQIFDDDRDGGIIAPPQFCVALEWPVVSGPLARQAYGMEPQERVRGVHASQDSIFHQPIRPGMKLRTVGTVVGVRRARAGVHTTAKLETFDSDTGDTLVTSWTTSIIRDVDVAGDDNSTDAPPPLPAASGIATTEATVFIPREMPHTYTECADIWNPIHTEREVALAAGLPDIILHGTATWALAGREVIRTYCNGDPARLKRLHGRFTAMVIPGHEIRISLDEAADGAVGFTVFNHQEQAALSNGLAVVA
ncbi:MAG: MaoC/PaaZ C-terminal domain-containing protein [Hyphomicrobiaceae bacterium]